MNRKMCQVCGAEALVLNEWKKEYKCCACDAVFAIEDSFAADAEALNDFQDAERLLQQNPPSFDYAETQFDLIIRKFPTWSAGYWGRLRAKYCIKYEIDYNGKSVPSCYMAIYEDIRENDDYKNALRYASPELKQVYVEQALRIAEVARVWRENAKKYNYDVFISFKETDDETHSFTRDRQEMFDLYNHLTTRGYKVFFSPVSLHQRDIYGAQSEPYIFDAIDDAKIMIVYGSKAEYFNSTWVQNEWQRYYLAIGKGMKNPGSLIVAYEGFNAIDLPNVLRKNQAIDANSKHFYNDIVELIEKFCKPSKQNNEKVEEKEKKRYTKRNSSEISCPACGGNFSTDDLLDGDRIVTCLTCGKSFLTSEILKEKGNPFKRTPKTKAPKRELSYEEIRMAEERALKFKKSKFSKVILFTLIIFAALTIGMFSSGNILLGFLAAGVAGLSLVSYLCGMQIIKKGNINLHLLPAILAFALIVPYCIVGGGDLAAINWDDVVLKDYVPENDFKFGTLSTNSAEELRIYSISCSDKEFYDYVSKCKDFGYDYEIVEEDGNAYVAFNEAGYKIDLSYYSSLTIELDAPIRMTNIQWPQSDIAKLLPTPKSSYGHIKSEYTTSFDIYIGNTSFEEYKQYVESVYQAGFTVDYRKDTNQFTADNADGYYVRIEYIGFNTMEIYIRDP